MGNILYIHSLLSSLTLHRPREEFWFDSSSARSCRVTEHLERTLQKGKSHHWGEFWGVYGIIASANGHISGVQSHHRVFGSISFLRKAL